MSSTVKILICTVVSFNQVNSGLFRNRSANRVEGLGKWVEETPTTDAGYDNEFITEGSENMPRGVPNPDREEDYELTNISISDDSKAQQMIYNELIKTHPYMAYIRVILKYKRLNCAGTIITILHVLTAAKCLYDEKNEHWASVENTTITVGATYPFREEGTIHKPYVLYPSLNYPWSNLIDLGVIELEREMRFSAEVASVKLAGPTQSSLIYEMMHLRSPLLVVGWGGEKDPGIINKAMINTDKKQPLATESTRLLAHFTRLSPFDTCKKHIFPFDGRTQICAERGELQEASLCPGTRGGPVLWKEQQFGLVSWGTCINPKRLYNIFSRLDTLRGYIDDSLYKSGRYKPSSSNHLFSTPLAKTSFIVHSIQLYIATAISFYKC